METNKRSKYIRLSIIVLINIIIFGVTNLVFDLKYEQVDDFIIYNLYSGLDGTYNIHGIYMHPVLCMVIGSFFRLISSINWHTIFLLTAQFICFTTIGYLLLKKHQNKTMIILYAIFASVFYTALLLLIQYTSVAALLILTAFFIIVHTIEENKNKWQYILLYIVLYSLGIMLRMQSLLIILPFLAIYGIDHLIKLIKKQIEEKQFVKIVKAYAILLILTIVIYISNYCFYTNNINKEYLEYNNLRSTLHDLSSINYETHKPIYDEIGWSENDFYLFYTFDFGDENVYCKENLQKIIDYKISTNQYWNFNLDTQKVITSFIEETTNTNATIVIAFITIGIISIITNKDKRKLNIIIMATTICIHLLFIIINRSMLRVVIPEYILGTLLLINNFAKVTENQKEKINYAILIIPIILMISAANDYEYNYNLKSYSNYKEIINYTNEHKENVYLYTTPSLQYRYLAYSVYEMPPQESFSNLRVLGGWDMFTENYYDFKARNNLEGTFLDLLKENVYLINGNTNWSGINYNNYINRIVLFLEENYNIQTTYEKIEEFGNLYIYKLRQQ